MGCSSYAAGRRRLPFVDLAALYSKEPQRIFQQGKRKRPGCGTIEGDAAPGREAPDVQDFGGGRRRQYKPAVLCHFAPRPHCGRTEDHGGGRRAGLRRPHRPPRARGADPAPQGVQPALQAAGLPRPDVYPAAIAR